MKLHYLANPASPHVLQWLDLLEEETELTIFCIGEEPARSIKEKNIEVRCPIPEALRSLPKILKYVYLGLWLRSFAGELKPSNFIHAHNSSGYGFSAYLAGIPYLLTTYGSEIFSSESRGGAYNRLLARILGKAVMLTATAPAMHDELTVKFGIDPRRIETFSLGVSSEFENGPSGDGGRAPIWPVWFSNRRILPHYYTAEIVRAFLRHKAKGGRGELWLLQGDAAGDYTDDVRAEALKSQSGVRFIEGFVSRAEMVGLLGQCHFSISVPASDQLSSAILESMSQGCVPVVRDLPAYVPVSKSAITIGNVPDIENALVDMFQTTQNITEAEWKKRSTACILKIREDYSRESVANRYLSVLKKMQRAVAPDWHT